MAITSMESYHMERLFEGLAKLNVRPDDSLDSTQKSLSADINEEDFAELIVECIEGNDTISQTIEEVITNSQIVSINDSNEDLIRNSQKLSISQTIENVVKNSQKMRTNRNKFHSRRGQTSRRRLSYVSSSDGESNESTEVEDNASEGNVVYVDAGTQTDVKKGFDESIDSLFGFEQEMEEVVCDCDSDECCDQCCDQGSDQCECDCEKCEYEKCKRIPQLDGAFDSDDSGSQFSPDYKEDDDEDSDFEVGSRRTKRTTPKKGGRKRPQNSNSRTSANKRKKTTITRASPSDDSDVEVMAQTSYSGPVARKSSPRKFAVKDPSPSASVESVDREDDVFLSSSGRKVKSSKNLSTRLWDQFKPHDSKKGTNDSIIHMSFSESEGEDREITTKSSTGLDLLGFKDFSYTAKKSSNSKSNPNSDNRSVRSVTPYLSHESEDEIIPQKTKPGPKFSKAGPKSSKIGPKSSKIGPKSSKPGPASSKAPKPGPKSSKVAPKAGPKSSKTAPKIGPKSSKKRDSIESDSDLFSYEVTSRSRRSAAKGVNYDDDIERTSSLYSQTKPKTPAKTTSKRKTGKSNKSELDSALESILSPMPSPEPFNAVELDYDLTADLVWKSINGELVRIDYKYYDNEVLDTIRDFEIGQFDLYLTPREEIQPYLARYADNEDYWSALAIEVEEELGNTKSTRSKGSLKDFYTLPHLNQTIKSQIKSAPKARPKSRSNSKTKTKSENNSNSKKSSSLKSNEFARLMTDASHYLDNKPLTKRGTQTTPSKPTVAKKTPVAKQTTPKRSTASNKSKASGKSNSKSSARQSRSRSRPSRGVTSSTLFTTISIPFIESDIRVVTDLVGYKKKAHLKQLCLDFELDVVKLPDRYLKNYTQNSISPFLFDNIYYNDYRGYLTDEDSQLNQEVLITMKEIINSVVSVSQCCQSLVSEVENQLDPKPMLDTREDDYFDDEYEAVEEPVDWDYSHFADEEQGVAVANDDVVLIEDNGVEEIQEEDLSQHREEGLDQHEIRAASPLSELVLKTFGSDFETKSNEDNEEVINGNGPESEPRYESEAENVDQNVSQTSDNEEQELSEEQNEDSIEERVPEMSPSYQTTDQQYSPPAEEHRYSNNNQFVEENSPQYQSNQFEEEAEQSSDSSSSSNHVMAPNNNSALNVSNVEHIPQSHVPIHANSGEAFKMQPNYSTDMFGYGMPQMQSQNMAYHQNPLQNPIVPTLMPHTSAHYSQPNVYPTQQNWTQNLQMNQMSTQMQYNLNPNPEPQQTDSDFDVSNYSYMEPYYPSNPNIPQFDGIFDDDSFQSEGNQFNMKCNSDSNIEQLSQGSRSEEMSANTPSKPYIAANGPQDEDLEADNRPNERPESQAIGPRTASSGAFGRTDTRTVR